MKKKDTYPHPKNERVSYTMSRIRSTNTSIEVALRKALWAAGLRYRKNYPYAIGKPDVAFPGLRVAVFCDSSFWHGRDWNERRPKIKSNPEYWRKKIAGNITRDKDVNQLLAGEGWLVLRFWDNDITQRLDECVDAVVAALKSRPVPRA